MKERDDKEQGNPTKRSIAPDFAAFQLAKALTAHQTHPDPVVRHRAEQRVATWTAILGNIFSGSRAHGSRTPIKDVPPWATLEVATGGFATGKLLAGGPLSVYEREILARIGTSREGEERLTLNTYFLTDAGLAELQGWLSSGHYDLRIPEEGALLAVAWLATHGHGEAAREIIEAIAPFFSTLRFYPVPDYRPRHFGARVHVQDVGATREHIAAIRVNEKVLAQKMAAEVWAPLHDRMLALFAETMADDFWPCQVQPADWTARAHALLAEYAEVASSNRLPSRYRKPGSHYVQLHAFLQQCAQSFDVLSPRELGRLRLILRRSIEKRGLPFSATSREFRQRQRDEVRAPLYKDIGTIVERRLAACPQDDGLDSVDALKEPIAASESSATVPAGTAIPRPIARKLERCLNETIELLVRRGLIPSSEALARVLPQMTSSLRSLGIDDPVLRGLYAAIYRAFRKRRSLLLLNLEHQVQIEELPWVAAIEQFRSANLSDRATAKQALEEIVLLALQYFPHAILPNKLVNELNALATGAGIDLPLVDELATDIFMGQFSKKYTEAAKLAGNLLRGSLYSTYYRIDHDAIERLENAPSSKWKLPWQRTPSISDDFARICAARAGVPPGTWSPATNGMIIEQQQILTTQNLAGLIVRLDLREALQGRYENMAQSCFRWICTRGQVKLLDWHAELIRVKNMAYAWRQMIFFLSLLDKKDMDKFMAWADSVLALQSPAWRERFLPVLHGLKAAVAATFSGAETDWQPFLGWSVSRHWLIP